MATQEQLDSVLSNISSGDHDQVTPLMRQEWPGLFYLLAQEVLNTAELSRRATVDGDQEGADDPAGLVDWVNPFTLPILVRLVLDLTTPAAGACTASFGVAAGSVLSDDLVDDVDLAAGAGVLSSHDDPGTNGRAWRRVEVGEHVTGSTSTGAAAGAAGTLHILYRFA
jgi:hypothetical protein